MRFGRGSDLEYNTIACCPRARYPDMAVWGTRDDVNQEHYSRDRLS